MSRDGKAPKEIASQLETSQNYVYRVRSDHKDKWNGDGSGNGKQASVGGDSAEPQASTNDILTTGNEALTSEANENETLQTDDQPAKTYDCGECGHSVEYLQKKCDECGSEFMWSAVVN